MDETRHRDQARHRGGANILLVMPCHDEDVRTINNRLPRPLMYIIPADGITAIGMSILQLDDLEFLLIADPGMLLFAMSHALHHAYHGLGFENTDPIIGNTGLTEETFTKSLTLKRCALSNGGQSSVRQDDCDLLLSTNTESIQ